MLYVKYTVPNHNLKQQGTNHAHNSSWFTSLSAVEQFILVNCRVITGLIVAIGVYLTKG